MLDYPFQVPANPPFPVAQRPSLPTGSTWKLSPSREAVLLIAFVALQVVILFLMILLDGAPLVLGERLKLKVVPVDPRDLFRGDYVVLDYGFNRLGQIEGTQGSPDWYSSDISGRDVYIHLKPEKDYFVASSASLTRPASGPFLRGRASYPGHIECGIESYYVQEGEGLRLEQAIRQGTILAEVAVWRGQAKLVRLVE